MPNIYHNRRRSPSLSSSSSTELGGEHPTDADDSIVLSDLVRTGEASRLRRRGAMRLEHGLATHTTIATPSLPAVMLDDSDEEVTRPTNLQLRDRRQRRYSSLSRQRERERRAGGSTIPYGIAAYPALDTAPVDVGNEYRYTLMCGGIDPSEVDSDGHDGHRYSPSPLPLYPPAASSSSTNYRPRRKPRPINGCGALVHLNAAPSQRLNMWTAKSSATSVVVGMEPIYFDREAVCKIVRSACGCIREGVGCAACGNPLGTRYVPCKTATDGLFTSRPKPPSPLRPEGPRYWHGSPPSSPATQCVYSFFSTAVSSYPHFIFSPETQIPPTHMNNPDSPLSTTPPYIPVRRLDAEEMTQDTDGEVQSNPVYNNSITMFDRYITASPTPLSDVGEAVEEELRVGFVGDIGTSQSFYQQQMQIRIETQAWQSRQDQEQDWGWGMTRTRERLNSDGEEYVHGDVMPGSPDKISEGTVLAER